MGCQHTVGLANGEGLLLNDGTVLHLHSCRSAEEADQPEFDNLKCTFAETLVGPCPWTVDLNLSCTSTQQHTNGAVSTDEALLLGGDGGVLQTDGMVAGQLLDQPV